MDERNAGELQIYAVEEATESAATCIVRCVGGVVRAGQRFGVESVATAPSAKGPGCEESSVTLEWIECYGQRARFIDPPHSAKVFLTGGGVPLLKKGLIITSGVSD